MKIVYCKWEGKLTLLSFFFRSYFNGFSKIVYVVISEYLSTFNGLLFTFTPEAAAMSYDYFVKLNVLQLLVKVLSRVKHKLPTKEFKSLTIYTTTSLLQKNYTEVLSDLKLIFNYKI